MYDRFKLHPRPHCPQSKLVLPHCRFSAISFVAGYAPKISILQLQEALRCYGWIISGCDNDFRNTKALGTNLPFVAGSGGRGWVSAGPAQSGIHTLGFCFCLQMLIGLLERVGGGRGVSPNTRQNARSKRTGRASGNGSR